MNQESGNELSSRLTTELIKEVSERKHVESLISLFVKYAPGAIAMFDRNLNYLVASDRWYKDYKLNNQDIVGRSLYELSEQFQNLEWKDFITRALKGEQLKNDEDKIVTNNGLTVWFKWEILPWHDKNGRIGGLILSTDVINEKKQLENDLKRSNELLSMALNAGGVGFWHWTEMDNRLEWNDKMFEIFEMARADFTGDGDQFFQQIHTEDLDPLRDLLDQVLADRGEYHTKYRVVSKSGERIIKEHGKVFEEEGVLRMTGICHDITEEETSKKDLKDLNTVLEYKIQERTIELDTANKELKGLTYSLSHDLRAPLLAIKGYVEILQEDYNQVFDPIGNRMLDRIVFNSSKMTRLIDDLLAFSRVVQQKLTITEVDTNTLLSKVMKKLPVHERSRIKLSDLPIVRGDQTTLSQLFDNLVDNALKFSRDSENGDVEIFGETNGEKVMISVKDYGVGFDMVNHHKLFRVFQRLHTERDFPGNGVGLALSAKIAEIHKGEILAEAQTNLGAKFTLVLPK
ncbi:MAG: ATP-binding protein [Marinoscillum sp.]